MQASPTERPRPSRVAPVPLGPRAYRTRLRTRGPLTALVPPGVVATVAALLLAGSNSAARGVAGFGLAVLAAPGLLVAGAPLRAGTGTYLVAAVGSAALWLALGAVAARRATRRPVASWRDYWGELTWLSLGVVGGVVLSLVLTNLVLGGALL